MVQSYRAYLLPLSALQGEADTDIFTIGYADTINDEHSHCDAQSDPPDHYDIFVYPVTNELSEYDTFVHYYCRGIRFVFLRRLS